MARHLNLRQIPVTVFAIDSPSKYRGDALINLQILERLFIPLHFIQSASLDFSLLKTSLSDADWVVDSLLGTGVNGEPREPVKSIIETLNESGKPIFSVDLPSGLNADTGESYGTVIRARATGTMVAWKRGLGLADPDLVGEVETIPLGINLPEAAQLSEEL